MNKEYTQEEMIEEIVESIEEIGGEVVVLSGTPDGFPGGFQLFINPHLMDQAELIVNDIQMKYKEGRKRRIQENPFLRIEELLEDL